MRFVLHEPWPDFMTFYGTLATSRGLDRAQEVHGAGRPRRLQEAPVGLGPYKFVSHTPGVELVLEANESYWRKVPSVKRLVFKSVPDATTRMAMLKRGEVDVAYLLDGPIADEVKRDPTLKLAFSGAIGTFYLDFLDQWDAKSPWHDRRVRLAASLALDRKAINEAENLGASRLNGNIVPRTFDFAVPIEPHAYDPAQAKKLLAEAGYPNGFDVGDLHPWPPYSSMGESDRQLPQRGRSSRRACARWSAPRSTRRWPARSSRACASASTPSTATPPRACRRRCRPRGPSRTAPTRTSRRSIASRRRRPDRKKREPMLHQIQQLLDERVRFAPIYDYIWPSGIGPRVDDPALMLIDPYPWSAPLEEVKLKKR